MKQYYQPGDICVNRGVVNNKVWLAQSVIVVKDTQDETVLLLMPGAQCAFPEGYWRWRRNKDYSHGTRWQEAQGDSIHHREFTWHTNRILMFLEPELYYSCFMFWDHDTNRFMCWYINFQLPYHRSRCGFDSLDLDLDIVIAPDHTWEWKDEDEYQEGIREGGILPEWVQGIENAKPGVFNRITRHAPPLNDAWLDWRPDPNWAPPTLPTNWEVL